MKLIPRLLKEVVRNVTRKPATLQYPIEKREIPEGFRGRMKWSAERCIGCGLCGMDCPTGAIELMPLNVSSGGRPQYRRIPIFHYYRCIFCYQCVEVCPTKAILPTTEYDLSTYDKSKVVRKPSKEELSIITNKFMKRSGGK